MNIIETNWNWKSGLSTRATTDYIVLHHAAAVNCTPQDIDNWHKGNGWTGIGYHFFVRKDGTIYRGRPLWALGAHVAGSNSNSIGICAEGNFDIEKQMRDEQKYAIAELLDYLHKYHFPNAKIVGHRDIGSSACPGKYYPLEELKNYKRIVNSEEDLTMSQYEELKKEIEQLKSTVAERTGYYNYIDGNMNEAFKPTVKKLVESGKLKGNEKGKLMLTTDMMRTLTILDRAGVFDKEVMGNDSK